MTSLIQAISAWTLGQRIQDEVSDLLDATTLNSLPLKEVFQVVVQEYRKLRDSIRIHSTRSELVELKRSLEPLMKCLNEKAAIDFKPADSSVSSLHHSSGSCINFMSPMPTPSRIKLGLPKFSGELLDLREFWSILSAHIEREAGLTNIEKITCLEDAMNDQTAKDLVCLNGYGGSYDIVVQALQARYDRHKLVYKHHVKQVLSLSPIADDYHSYINFKNIATKNINGLHASKGDSFEQLLTSLFEVSSS